MIKIFTVQEFFEQEELTADFLAAFSKLKACEKRIIAEHNHAIREYLISHGEIIDTVPFIRDMNNAVAGKGEEILEGDFGNGQREIEKII